MKARWGVVIALRSEAQRLFGRWYWRLEDGRHTHHMPITEGLELIIVRSGLGYKNAYSASHWLISQGVSRLMSLGISGGLDPGLKPGILVVADKVLNLNNGRVVNVWHEKTTVCQQAQKFLDDQGLIARIGAVLTVPRPVLSLRDKKAQFNISRALTADMESAAVALVATRNQLPFFGMRVVCDPARQAISREIGDLINQSGKIKILSLLNCLLMHPNLTAEFFHLAKQYRTAMTTLRRGWRVLVNQRFSFF